MIFQELPVLGAGELAPWSECRITERCTASQQHRLLHQVPVLHR